MSKPIPLEVPIDYVIQGLRNWEKIRKDEKELLFYFQNKTTFSFSCLKKENNSSFHAYPAVCDGALTFFILPDTIDNIKRKKEISGALQMCAAERKAPPAPGSQICPEEACRRIETWEKLYKKWIGEKLRSQPGNPVSPYEGLYRAFEIPADELREKQKYYAWFALREQDEYAKNYIADLIITSDLQIGKFLDTVRPVPPFGGKGRAAYYLLDLANP